MQSGTFGIGGTAGDTTIVCTAVRVLRGAVAARRKVSGSHAPTCADLVTAYDGAQMTVRRQLSEAAFIFVRICSSLRPGAPASDHGIA